MDATQALTDATPSLLQLNEFLSETNSPLSCEQALSLAIGDWIADQRARAAEARGTAARATEARAPARTSDGGVRGYQWKCLFLPEGAELRMTYAGTDFFARVGAGAIVYQGDRLTPRQFTLAVAGDGRNAWRDLWVRQPGEKTWTRAHTLRRHIEQRHASAPISPLDAVREATASMSDTLKSALALIEHANRHACGQAERRKFMARRDEDLLGDVCNFD
jgi:hypothetical protein